MARAAHASATYPHAAGSVSEDLVFGQALDMSAMFLRWQSIVGLILLSLEVWRESSVSSPAHLAGSCEAAAAHGGWPKEEVGVDGM